MQKPPGDTITREGLLVCLIVIAALIVRSLLFIGYQGFDDRTYVAYAWMFANGGDIVASKLVDPWIGRMGAWLPLALSIKVFGGREWALTLYSLVVSLATFPVLYVLGRHLFNGRVAICALALLAILPLDVLYATRAFSDEAVGFWSLSAFTVFILAIDCKSKRLAFLAGLTFGIAYLTKETALMLAIPFALLLVQRRFWSLPTFCWMAFGLFVVLCVEFAFWKAITDDPLYRWHSTLGSRADFVPSPKTIVTFWDYIPGPPPHEIFRSSNSLLEAFLMFTTNEEWGLLYFFVFPLALFALWKGDRAQKTVSLFILSVTLLLLFFPLHFPNYTLNRDPRYYTMLSGPALLLFSAWALRLKVPWRQLSLLALAVTWIPCLYIGVVSSDMGMEKAFVRWLKEHSNETVWMQPFDASNAIVLSQFDSKLNIGIVWTRGSELEEKSRSALPSPLVAMRPNLPMAPNTTALAGQLVALPPTIVVPKTWQLETTVMPPTNQMAETVRRMLSTFDFPSRYVEKIAPSQGKSLKIYRAG